MKVSPERAIEDLSLPGSFDWFFLAMAHWQLDNKDKAHTWYKKAAEWTEKNQPNNKELRRFRAEAEELMGITEQSTAKEKEEPHAKTPSRQE